MAQADSHTAISGAPVVESADRPTIGTDSSNPTATVYGNFKCPYTQGFVNGNLRTIIEEFVETGQLNIEFANLAYNPGSTSSYYISSSDPRLAAFGRAVWNEQPGNYWAFFEEMFAEQVSGYLTYDDIADEASARGVPNADAIANAASQYESAPDRVSSDAASDGVSWIPTMELAGDTAAPHHGTQAILNWIDARVDEAPSGTTEEQTSPESTDSADESDDSDTSDQSDEQDTSDQSETDSQQETTDDSTDGSGDQSDDESTGSNEESSDDSESSEGEASDEDTSSEETSGDDSESSSGGSADDSGSSSDSDDSGSEPQDDSDDSEPEQTSDTEAGGSCVIGEGVL